MPLTPYQLIVGPRLLITLASFLIDLSLYKLLLKWLAFPPKAISKVVHNSSDPKKRIPSAFVQRAPQFVNDNVNGSLTHAQLAQHQSFLSFQAFSVLLLHSTCYVSATFYTHTFSNTVETILFSLLLCILFASVNANGKPPAKECRWIHLKLAVLLSFGFFNRPTFALFAFVPVLWWAWQHGSPRWLKNSNSSFLKVDVQSQTESNSTAQLQSTSAKQSTKGSSKLPSKPSNGVVAKKVISQESVVHEKTKMDPITWYNDAFKNFSINSVKLFAFFAFFSVFLIIFDTFYYRQEKLYKTMTDLFLLVTDSKNSGYQSWSGLLRKFASNLVLTPFNFASYNLQTKNLENHGLHPRWMHAVVNMPMLFTVLVPFILVDFFRDYRTLDEEPPESSLISVQPKRMQVVLQCSLGFSLIAFSVIPHQEPRFLLPLVPIMFVLYGQRFIKLVQICNQTVNQQHHQVTPTNLALLLMLIWIGLNLTLFIFYAFIHQSGVVASLTHIKSTYLDVHAASATQSSQLHLIFASMYLPPRHLLAIPVESNRTIIHDLSVEEFPSSLQKTLSKLLTSPLSDQQIILTLPGALTKPLEALFSSVNGTFGRRAKLSLVKQFFPHFTGEDIGESLRVMMSNGTAGRGIGGSGSFGAWMSKLQSAFSMNIWNVVQLLGDDGGEMESV